MRIMLIEWAWVLVLGAAMAGALVLTQAGERLNAAVYDGLLRLNAPPASDRLIVVAIDEQSLREVGPWPWDRRLHAELIDRLTQANAAGVAYDVLFLDPAADPAEDAALGWAIARSGRVCLPELIERPGYDGAPFRVTGPPMPMDAAQLGQSAIAYDADGVVRRVLLREQADRPIPHITACALQRAGETRPSPAQALLRFAPPSAFRAVSASSVLRGETPPAFFKDRYVLVGVTAPGSAQPVATAVGAMTGVELDASLLNALLTDSLAQRAGVGLQLAFAFTGLVGVMLALALLPPKRALPIGFGIVIAALAASAATLFLAKVWIPPVALVVTIVVIFPLWGWRRLEAASGYMMRELQRFADEAEVLPAMPGPRTGGDLVARQIQLMDQTIRRARDLRRFASDTLRHLPDPTVVVGPRGRVLFANAHAEALGVRPGDFLPRLAAGWTTLETGPFALPSGPAVGEGWTAEAMSPQGRVYLAAAAPYRDSAGGLSAWIVRLTDITELKAAEAQREEFIQFLTHDMRSPQSSILALLETAPPDAVPPELSRKLGDYARRTLALAGNFVQLARAGSPQLEFEPLDLADVATEAVDDLWPQARRARIRLTLKETGEELLVRGERALLTRAVMNLIENALKYSPPDTEATVGLRREGDHAVLVVADQGRGMSDDQRQTLFDRFRRYSARDRKTVEGAGLGLALVWEVVRRHGGTIVCDSVPEQGTCFTLRLPLAED